MAQLVSILIPAYNADRWIAGAIQSAIDQTWPQKEIIIVDDGSSDDTFRIAKRYESPIIKVITQENKGASAARNKALSFAQGGYIQWLDADNLLAPDKISQQMKYVSSIENDRILFSSAWGRFYYRYQKAIFSPTSLWTDLTPLEWIYRKLSENNVYIVPECYLVSRVLTEMAGPWNENLSLDDDGEYFNRIVMSSEMIKFIAEARSFYRTGNLSSLSNLVKRSDEKLESQFSSICAQISSLLSLEDSLRTRSACIQYLQRNLIYFYPEKKDIIIRAQKLARELGGNLSVPKLKWKYSFFKNLFGWTMAKKMVFKLSTVKLLLRKNFDKLLYDISKTKKHQALR
jgi:glycosyltransferase involved in cell wall biosynthesis